jgi:high affinity Mn2+ porin
MRTKCVAAWFTMFLLALASFAGPAFATHPDLVVPEKVSSSHTACVVIMGIGKKYQVEGLFSKEFVEGQCQLARLDVAVAVQMLTEKIAEKAAKEGTGAIDKEDLAILSDLKEELRGEMLLAQSRAFQTRNTELGTNLHALTKNIIVPEKVPSTHKACQEIMRIGKKYQVEGLFSKEFVEGQCQLARLDVAVAVQLLTEKIAEKAAKEGTGAVDKEDLAILSDLKEELRGEMLLAQSRAFQTRYTELGTNLHALTKNITISGGMTGVLQGSIGNKPRDYADSVGRADMVFNFKVGESTIAVIDVEATGGSGIDAHIGNYSILNNIPMAPTDTVRFRTAWIEHTAFDDRLVFTIGKIGLTDYFDNNGVANNETAQFLGGALVNSAVLGAPSYGPGMRVTARVGERVTLGVGYGSGDTTGDNILDHGFGIVELGYKQKTGELEGNYRFYGSLDGALPVAGGIKSANKNALGTGVSIDQQVTGQLTLFGRFGWHDEDVYLTRSAWSAGFQYVGLIPQRKDDLVGFGYGQVLINNATAQEKLLETYYKAKVSDQLAISPHFQYLINPLADKSADNVFVASLRAQLIF